MKFKQQYAQNQRIERITSNHIVIGIDIAKETQVARAVTYRGIELGRPCSFKNDDVGYLKLLSWVKSLQKEHNKNSVMVGMEPTGHYWLNLAWWLLEQRFEVVTVNPYHVKSNKENRDNSPTKSDLKDALVIADMVKNGYYSPLRLPTGKYQALRVLMSDREFVIKQFISIQNQIHRWLDIWFPEYHRVFKDWSCKTSLVTLRLFPLPSELKILSPEEIYASWKPHMKRRASISFAKVLVEQAQQSIAQNVAPEQVKRSLLFLLDQYERLTTQLGELEQEAISLMKEIPQAKSLLTIPGIGKITIAGILAETGDLSMYRHGQQVLRLAGLHLGEDSSGKHKGQVRITKRGRSGLRKFLYLAVLHLVVNNEEFRSLHHHYTRTKKMKKIHSIIKLCGKLARILVGITRQEQTYNPEKVVTAAIAA
ncbi:IS110 family RNA-guided transposase [Paenibacillus roseipurpureus]|uniref:IS110 family transposase n=1 Tax=Paenibacillus roseopurpureus TaxID=2918901 RepID=A0AA96LUT2_9BACL|nr:IS110 family transposase [Paenibacillus sp. MBLB1832]WNR46886.1 IS110 family transposase [Paenibacillus sp. MBLB1832]